MTALTQALEASQAKAVALCDDVRGIVLQAGVKRGHNWRPYEPGA